MFIEKHEPVQGEDFTWFDDNGNVVDTEEPQVKSQLSTINRYIVEISQQNRIVIPQFINWLFREGYRIYCINDCIDIVAEMTTIQKILFEREQVKGNWEQLENNKHIYKKEFSHIGEVEFLWDSILFISKRALGSESLLSLLEDFKMNDSRFPNLSFPRILAIHNDLIIAKVTWGESYFKPQTNEEPVVLVCYTAQKI
ncbi:MULTISPECIES: hypothetical protein [Bacillaceae]|uniref:Uncharacterized protein n=1 Tax=Peribacillus huizhouensis TaxID=1501239 RepID=A0ABR6CUA4_9BACI|nr:MULTISPECIES: hypothetical protein [Bacillaceae]MBA9028585.1 hypothetical protein [Peribacillus huizhouensis]